MYIYSYVSRVLLPLLAILLAGFTHQALASGLNVADNQSCEYYFRVYEKKFQIPEHLLKAISLQESGLWSKSEGKKVAWPWTMNANGKGYRFSSMREAVDTARKWQTSGLESFDVGCMQVNMRYHPDAFRDLNQAFNPKYNVAYAAYILRKHYEESESWDKAVAYYHSKTMEKGDLYVRQVRKIWHEERNTNALALLDKRQKRMEEVVMADRVIAHYPISKPKPELPSFEISRN